MISSLNLFLKMTRVVVMVADCSSDTVLEKLFLPEVNAAQTSTFYSSTQR